MTQLRLPKNLCNLTLSRIWSGNLLANSMDLSIGVILSIFDFDIEYIKGETNSLPDFLTREFLQKCHQTPRQRKRKNRRVIQNPNFLKTNKVMVWNLPWRRKWEIIIIIIKILQKYNRSRCTRSKWNWFSNQKTGLSPFLNPQKWH